MRSLLLSLLTALGVSLASVPAPVTAAPAHPSGGDDPAAASAQAAPPDLDVSTIASNLDLPWDLVELPAGGMLFTQRNVATLSLLQDDGAIRQLEFPSSDVWVSGETGLLGLEIDPAFATNRRIYTCQGATTRSGRHEVQVHAWTIDAGLTKATSAGLLLGGIPSSNGRHGGCRLLITTTGALLVGTGDAAIGTNPRNLNSLGGKTLRLNRFTGAPWPSNPYIGGTGKRRYVQTYGHRNVQGLAQRADGSLWSIEHGPAVDDEVNRLFDGGDYGWNPVPGYNEGVPMTDFSLPGPQIGARWSSGDPTVATSGGTFVQGAQWGVYDGALAVACLNGERGLFMSFDASGHLVGVRAPAALKQFGRLRTMVQLSNGDLLVLTSNGGSTDVILRVRPV